MIYIHTSWLVHCLIHFLQTWMLRSLRSWLDSFSSILHGHAKCVPVCFHVCGIQIFLHIYITVVSIFLMECSLHMDHCYVESYTEANTHASFYYMTLRNGHSTTGQWCNPAWLASYTYIPLLEVQAVYKVSPTCIRLYIYTYRSIHSFS